MGAATGADDAAAMGPCTLVGPSTGAATAYGESTTTMASPVWGAGAGIAMGRLATARSFIAVGRSSQKCFAIPKTPTTTNAASAPATGPSHLPSRWEARRLGAARSLTIGRYCPVIGSWM